MTANITRCLTEQPYTEKEIEAILDKGKPANPHMVKRLVSTIAHGYANEPAEDQRDNMGICEACDGTGYVCNRRPRVSWERMQDMAEHDTGIAEGLFNGYYYAMLCERCIDE